jgi:hypothetical protein
MLTYNLIMLVGCTSKDLQVAGNLDYMREVNSPQETLKKAVELKYRQNLHETRDKKYLIYLGGKVYVDYDAFRNTSKVNTMSSLGLEF